VEKNNTACNFYLILLGCLNRKGWDRRSVYRGWVKSELHSTSVPVCLKGRDHLRNLNADGKIILKFILKNVDLIQLINDGVKSMAFTKNVMKLRVPYKLGIYWSAEQLSAFPGSQVHIFRLEGFKWWDCLRNLVVENIWLGIILEGILKDRLKVNTRENHGRNLQLNLRRSSFLLWELKYTDSMSTGGRFVTLGFHLQLIVNSSRKMVANLCLNNIQNISRASLKDYT